MVTSIIVANENSMPQPDTVITTRDIGEVFWGSIDVLGGASIGRCSDINIFSTLIDYSCNSQHTYIWCSIVEENWCRYIYSATRTRSDYGSLTILHVVY